MKHVSQVKNVPDAFACHSKKKKKKLKELLGKIFQLKKLSWNEKWEVKREQTSLERLSKQQVGDGCISRRSLNIIDILGLKGPLKIV